MLKIILLTFILLFAIFGKIPGGAIGERPDYKAEIKEISFKDGISKEEAIIIAQNYILETEGEEDYIIPSAEIFAENDPYWSKEFWHVSFKTKPGFKLRTGLEWTVVNVNKQTGEVASGGGGPS